MIFSFSLWITPIYKLTYSADTTEDGHTPYSNKERVLKSPYYLAENLWNQLDEVMQTIQTRFNFKKRLNFVDVDSFKIGTER